MRVWVAAALLVALFAGCAGSGGPDAGPVGSPRWVAGQFWETASTYHDVGERTGEGATRIDVQGNSTARLQILAPDLQTRRGTVALALSNASDDRGDTDEWLTVRVPSNFSGYALEAWTAVSCSGADICHPPIAGTLRGTAHGLLDFPLHLGKAWTYEDPDAPGSGWEARVAAVAAYPTLQGDIPSYVIQVRTHYDDDGDGDFFFSERGNVTAYYAPSVGYFAGLEGEGTSTFGVRDEGRETSRTTLRWTWRTSLVRTGVADDLDLDGLVQRLKLGTEPPSGSLPGDVTVTIDEHPEVVDRGTTWTFHARADKLGEHELAWRLVRDAAGNETTVQEGRGAAFDAAFADAGWYEVEAFAVNADGQRVGRGDRVSVGARLLASGTGTCAAAVAPLDLAPDTCTGLTFQLPPGAYHIRGSALYEQGQAALPCPYLALYVDGEEERRNYAWPELEADIESLTSSTSSTSWELRWVPSLSTGTDVTYEVTAEPIRSASIPAGRAC